jgi:hypothetical protein
MTQAIITAKIDSILQEMRQITVFITYISVLDIYFTGLRMITVSKTCLQLLLPKYQHLQISY